MPQREPNSGHVFPRAPSQEAWDAMGPEERARVVDSLTGMMDATRLEDMVEELQQRLDEEARLRQEAEQRQRDAERRAAELLAELERLKGRR